MVRILSTEAGYLVDGEFGLPDGAAPAVGLAAYLDFGGGVILYAVNGTDAVYRLREDGVGDVWNRPAMLVRLPAHLSLPRADQRIELEPK